jgi:uncharacterized integral membrane protein
MTTEPPVPPPTASQQASAEGKRRRLRISTKQIVVVLIAAAVLWFALVNTRDVPITVWAHTTKAAEWLVVICSFLAGVIVGYLVRRRRRRNVR